MPNVTIPSSTNASGGGGTAAAYVPRSVLITDPVGTGNNQKFVAGSTPIADANTTSAAKFVAGSTPVKSQVGTGSGKTFITGAKHVPGPGGR